MVQLIPSNETSSKNMKIAILGWGSLTWDSRDLPIFGTWQKDGPILPIEFSRISNDGRLTLVIDERNGVKVPTRYALSSRTDLELAITDLQHREGTPNRDRIGFVDLQRNRQSDRALSTAPATCERIRLWAWKNRFDAVIWTALGPNFP
jgi:hypothetical protein